MFWNCGVIWGTIWPGRGFGEWMTLEQMVDVIRTLVEEVAAAVAAGEWERALEGADEMLRMAVRLDGELQEGMLAVVEEEVTGVGAVQELEGAEAADAGDAQGEMG